ncbi:MAG TPA: EamA family transporter [Candidatus Avidesulfovibrio excrementigallinarum]|nr:EamA family transporter [Candidatus Avidesulfovibrio excrementigallinarum]
MRPLRELSNSPWVGIGLILVSICSVQCGASLAKGLFSLVGPSSLTTLRLFFGSLILMALLRPRILGHTRTEWQNIVLYGLSMGFMNLLFYQAISRIPLGVAVGLEFTGPLLVSTLSSRRVTDFMGCGLAVVGIVMLVPFEQTRGGLDLTGVLFALGAGGCWALYIIFGRRAGRTGAASSVALGMLVAACTVGPVGLFLEGTESFRAQVLLIAAAVGLLSSALPYGLEMVALQRIPPRVFGVLMSLEPAMASCAGFLFLGETLTLHQMFALGCVIAASILITLGINRA